MNGEDAAFTRPAWFPTFRKFSGGETETGGVDNNELGSMGKPLSKTYGDQEVRFCCKPCVRKFEQNPARYLKKIGK